LPSVHYPLRPWMREEYRILCRCGLSYMSPSHPLFGREGGVIKHYVPFQGCAKTPQYDRCGISRTRSHTANVRFCTCAFTTKRQRSRAKTGLPQADICLLYLAYPYLARNTVSPVFVIGCFKGGAFRSVTFLVGPPRVT
jgi:hypothetical protein